MEKVCSRCGKSMFDCQCRPMTIAELEQEIERENLLLGTKTEKVEVMIDNKKQYNFQEKIQQAKNQLVEYVRILSPKLSGELSLLSRAANDIYEMEIQLVKNKTEVEVMTDNKEQRAKIEKSIASKTARLIELALDGEEVAYMQVLAGQIDVEKKELARIDQVIIKPVFEQDLVAGDVYFCEVVSHGGNTGRLFIEVKP